MENTGTHIIADLHDCDFSHYIDRQSLETIVARVRIIISNNGFTILGALHHSFGKNAFSIVFMLAESHISIHTWPESGYVSFDIYTCNYSTDNTMGTENIYQELIGLFSPKNTKKQIISREMKQI